MKRKIIAILFLIMLVLPTVALAQSITANPCTDRSQSGQAATQLPRCINQIYVWSLGVGALLAFLMIVVGGYYIMTAGGNAENSAKGKEYITSSLIGIVILFTAYLLLNQINPDLVNFNLDSLNGLKSQQQAPPTIRNSP